MKIAVTSNGNDLSAQVDPRFGRCNHFIVIDPDTMAFDVIDNNQSLDLPQGAGIQAGKTVAEAKVDVLITGNCGPKAFTVLERAGIQIVTGASGTVTEVVQKFKKVNFNRPRAQMSMAIGCRRHFFRYHRIPYYFWYKGFPNEQMKGDKKMKFAIPIADGKLTAHFGHCKEFAMVEVEDKKILGTEMLDPPPHEPGVLPRFG